MKQKHCLKNICFLFFLYFLLASSVSHANRKVLFLEGAKDSTFSSNQRAWILRYSRWLLEKKHQTKFVSPKEVLALFQGSSFFSQKEKTRVVLFQNYMKKGKVLLRFKKYAYAIKAFELANKLSETVFTRLSSQEIHEMYLSLAVTYLSLKQGKKTQEYVMKAVSFHQEATLQDSSYPTRFVGYYRSIQNWSRKNPSFALTFETEPAGAKVFFNLRYQGTTPLTLSSVPAGRHHFRFEKNGFQTVSRFANLDPQRIKQREIKNRLPLQKESNPFRFQGLLQEQINSSVQENMKKACTSLQFQNVLLLSPIMKDEQPFLQVLHYSCPENKVKNRYVSVGRNREEYKKKLQDFFVLFSQELGEVAIQKVEIPKNQEKLAKEKEEEKLRLARENEKKLQLEKEKLLSEKDKQLKLAKEKEEEKLRLARENEEKLRIEKGLKKSLLKDPKTNQEEKLRLAREKKLQERLQRIEQERLAREKIQKQKELEENLLQKKNNTLASKGKTAVYKKWWFWTVLVVGTGAIAVGTYFAIDSQKPPSATLLLTTTPKSLRVQKTIRLQSGVEIKP